MARPCRFAAIFSIARNARDRATQQARVYAPMKFYPPRGREGHVFGRLTAAPAFQMLRPSTAQATLCRKAHGRSIFGRCVPALGKSA